MLQKIDIKKIVDVLLSEFPSVVGVYVFGSAGTRFENKDSDIDLAVLPISKLSPGLIWAVQQKIAMLLNRDIDLVDLLQATTVFSFNVISSGKRIYCSNQYACDCFEMLTYTSYMRLNEERKEIITAIKNRGSIFNG